MSPLGPLQLRPEEQILFKGEIKLKCTGSLQFTTVHLAAVQHYNNIGKNDWSLHL